MKTTLLAALGALTLLPVVPAMAASEFSLGYDVDRFPARQLSLQSCHAAVARGAAALGYTTRVDQDQKTLVLHVSAPRTDGRALIS